MRFYPSRGVTYESHLTPPPHLIGLRVAALDALLEDENPRRRRQRRRAVARRCPTRRCGRTPAHRATATCSTSTSCAPSSSAAGYERVDQVEDRGQFAVRGGILDLYPATEERAVRVELFDIEVESLRYFSTFTQRSLGETESIEIAPAAELAARAPRAGRDGAVEDERPDIAELLPVDRFRELLDLIPADARR